MLANERVIRETARAYEHNRNLPFSEGSLTALEAGEAAGGDKRGKAVGRTPHPFTEEITPSSVCASTTRRTPGRAQELVRESSRALHPVHALRAEQGAAVGVSDRQAIEEEIARFNNQ